VLTWCKKLGFPSFVDQELARVPTTRFDDKTSLANLNVFGEVEEDILNVIDFEFLDKLDDHLKEYIQDWEMYP
jgi:hypothetical protein